MIATGLAGKAVIVTGGGAGIGRATALRFAAEGARVAVWDVREGGGEELVGALATAGGEGRYQAVDVTDSSAVERAVEEVAAAWGGVDVLINNAGNNRCYI